MNKYIFGSIVVVCMYVIGLISWSLMNQNSVIPAEILNQNDPLESTDIHAVTDTNDSKDVYDDIKNPKQESSTDVSTKVESVTEFEKLKKSLKGCNSFLYVDRDTGTVYPDDKVDADLTVMDLVTEIKGGSSSNCNLNIGYILYDSNLAKQVEYTKQCYFNFAELDDKQAWELFLDVSTTVSVVLMERSLSGMDKTKFTAAEKLENSRISEKYFGGEIFQSDLEIDEKNKNRVNCSSKEVYLNNNPTATSESSKVIVPSTSVQSTSTKEVDSLIHKLLVKIRKQAEPYYNKGYSYSGLCSDKEIISYINQSLDLVDGTRFLPNTHGILVSVASNGTNSTARTASCHTNGQSYVVATPLLSENAGFWCVDSQGLSKKIEVPPAAGALYCP